MSESLPSFAHDLLYTHDGLPVVSGAIEHLKSPAVRTIALANRRFLGDLSRCEFRPELAQAVYDWCCSLVQSKAHWSGKRLRLLPYQCFFLLNIYGLLVNGKRKYREALISVPRKNGKSSFLAAIALYALVEEDGAEVYCAAQSKEQASILYNYASAFVQSTPQLKREFSVHSGYNSKRIFWGNGRLMPIHADSRTLDGLNPNMVIYDEFLTTKSPDLYNVLKTSLLGRRSPLFILAGSHSELVDGFGYRYERELVNALDGGSINDSVFVMSYEPDGDLSNPDTWRLVNPAMGYLIDERDFAADFDQARISEEQWSAFAAKNLNLWPNRKVHAWIKPEVLDKCRRVDRITPNQGLIVAVDLSYRQDLSAAAIVGVDTGEMAWLFWVPSSTIEDRVRLEHSDWKRWVESGFVNVCDGDYVNVEQVYADLRGFCANVGSVLLVGYDRYRAEDFKRLASSDGLLLRDFPQHRRYISPAVRAFEIALHNGDVSFVENPVAMWCLSNVSLDVDNIGNYQLVKPKGGKRARIDGAVVAVMAWKLRLEYTLTEWDPVV